MELVYFANDPSPCEVCDLLVPSASNIKRMCSCGFICMCHYGSAKPVNPRSGLGVGFGSCRRSPLGTAACRVPSLPGVCTGPGCPDIWGAVGHSDKALSVARPADVWWALMAPWVMIWPKCGKTIVFIPKKVLNNLSVW